MTEQTGWIRAIDEALVVHHISIADPTDDYETAKHKLNTLLSVVQDIGAYFQTKPEQEPVAHSVVEPLRPDEYQCRVSVKWVGQPVSGPLYTAPTPRRPLTDEEIDRVTDQQWAQNNHKPIYAAHRAYARAVIAAYEAKNSATGEGA